MAQPEPVTVRVSGTRLAVGLSWPEKVAVLLAAVIVPVSELPVAMPLNVKAVVHPGVVRVIIPDSGNWPSALGAAAVRVPARLAVPVPDVRAAV